MIRLVHTITYWDWSKDLGDFGVQEATKHEGDGVPIKCNAQPQRFEDIFRRFGVEVKNPWRFYIHPSSASAVKRGGRVLFGDRIMIVQIPPEPHAQGLSVDHAFFVAEEVREGG